MVMVMSAKQMLAQIEAEECRRSLMTFAKCVWPLVEPNPFKNGLPVEAMVLHLEAVARGDIRKLVINIPPRHTKSLLVSVIWPVWMWIQNPSERFLCASYSYTLSVRDNSKRRAIIEDPWFQARFGDLFQLDEKQNMKTFFQNTKQGYQMAISMEGGTTGQGGSCLLLDDPHNANDAHSEVKRQSALIWFREVWTNRLNDQEKDKMVTVGQRIHENDVCGYILRERPDWVHLNLPALFEPSSRCITPIWSDPRTEEGELLWPERFSNETLDGLKRDLGSIGFAAQYQQRPVPAGGGQFRQEWIRYFTETNEAYVLEKVSGSASVLKASCSLFCTVDLAISLKEENDYTVYGIWARTPENDLILLDVIRVRISNPDQLKQLRLIHQRYPGIYFKIERVGYQLALVQQALVEGIPCKEYNPPHTKDKVARASSFAIWMENEKVFFRQQGHYIHDLIPELLLFPKAPHDDQVDMCSMAADEVTLPQPEGGMIILPIDEQDTGLGWF